MSHKPNKFQAWRATFAASIAAIVAGCATPPAPPPPPPPEAPRPISVLPPVSESLANVSGATNARDYRRDAASHLYGRNVNRIYKGKMPPLLYAVGVLQVEVDGRGHVTSTSWMRAPSHAPEVVAANEHTVRLDEPY